MEGTEEEKNRFLADLDVVEDDKELQLIPRNEDSTQREGHKQVEVRQADEE